MDRFGGSHPQTSPAARVQIPFPVIAWRLAERAAALRPAVRRGLASAAAARAAGARLSRLGHGPVRARDDPGERLLHLRLDEDLLFGQGHELKWSGALTKLGVSAAQLSTQAGTA